MTKLVIWTDADGYKHRSFLRDSDPDHIAPAGIPDDPPPLDRLDWEAIKRDLHNLLLDRGLINWQDVQDSGNGVSSAVVTVLKRHVVGLYRTIEQERKQPGLAPGD